MRYAVFHAVAERNGVECIYADKVCANDDFDAWVEEGEKKLKHRVNWKQPRGDVYAFYASCRRNGRLDYEVMTREEVDAIRKRSRASSNGPWVTDYDEMGKKTCLRRMSKRWDLSPEAAEAVFSDDDTPKDITKVHVSAPIFAPREIAAPPQPSEPADDVDMSPPPPPESPTAPTPAPEKPTKAPTPAKATEADSNLKLLRSMLRMSKIAEGELLTFAAEVGLADSFGTLEELALANPSALAKLVEQAGDVVAKIKAAKGGAK